MAVDPLLSPATSQVAELQRASGDEKRRQESAALFLTRSPEPGSASLAASGRQKRNGFAIGGQADNSSGAQFPDDAEPHEASGGGTGLSPFAPDAARPARLAGIGFSAQLLAQGGEQNGVSSESLAGKGNQIASSAYNAVQRRGDGGLPATGPQIVTESGLIAGFGAFDNFSRLDVTV